MVMDELSLNCFPSNLTSATSLALGLQLEEGHADQQSRNAAKLLFG
jgi:hypothetical protein